MQPKKFEEKTGNKLTEIRDISGWIYNGMWQYCPEYPGAQITELPHPAFLPDDFHVYLQKFEIGGQSGTYIETKAHVDKSAVDVVDLPIESFYMPVYILDCGKKDFNEPVRLADVINNDINPGDAVILRSGWDENWEMHHYVSGSPYISEEAALWLFEKGIVLLGADFPRFDYPSNPVFPWDAFWEKVPLLLAPVCNLSGLSGRCGMLAAFPLKIKGACAAPCRAVIFRS